MAGKKEGVAANAVSPKARELMTALSEETGKHVILLAESWMESDRIQKALILAGSLAQGTISEAPEWAVGQNSADGCRRDLAEICGMTGMLHPDRCPLAPDQVEKALGYLRKSFVLEAPDRDVAIEFVKWAKEACR